jgi:hypothetical protein
MGILFLIHIKKQSDIRYALKLCVSDSNHFAHLDLMSVVLYVHSLKTTPTGSTGYINSN